MEVRREGGKGFQDRAGNAEVRDRLREWDKESSRALQQLGQIVWRPGPHPEVPRGKLGGGRDTGGRGRGGRPLPWGPGISRVSRHRWAEPRVEGRRASSRGRLEPSAREPLDGIRRGLASGQPVSSPGGRWTLVSALDGLGGTGRPSGTRINIRESSDSQPLFGCASPSPRS